VIWHHIFSPFPYFLFVFIRRGTGENLYFNLYICQKHGVHPSYLKQLFLIEKEYADRNMYTRSGIYKDIKRKIDEWTK